MRSFVLGLAALLVLSACGKNEAVYPIPGQPLYQAPYNPGGYGYPNNGGYPPGYGYPTGGFYPQMPQGYPQGYTPFLPLDYYMRNNPHLSGQWPGMWNQWNNYCNRYQVSPYNFEHFWFDFAPQVFNTNVLVQVYVQLDTNYYYWMQPGIQFGPQLNPQYFWQGYAGY